MTDIVKITSPAKPLQVVSKLNEVVDGVNDKQDKLVSGNNIKTINNTSLLGSGNIEITTGNTYTQGTGISIVNNTINHSNSITAGTVGTSSATSGSTLAVPYINYDSEGHITSKGTHIHTVTGFLTSSDVTSSYSQTGTDPINGTGVKKALDTLSIPTVTDTYSATSSNAMSGKAVASAVSSKQDTLVSGTNIKTVNNQSLLGSGNITIETSSTPNVDGETISYNNNEALQTIAVKNVRDNSTLPIWHGTEYQWNHGVPTTWYYWQTSETAMWTTSTMSSSTDWQSVTYGDGKFVAVANNLSNETAYSTDGINWTASTLPSIASWMSVTYGDGKFVAVARGSDIAAYSTDGINWVASTMPSSASWRSVTYGDGKFVAVAYNSDKAAYSTDGINWTETTLSSSADWNSVTYADGKFVAVTSSNSNIAAYSTDGINWTASTMPSSAYWVSVTYGNGKFVAVSGGIVSNKAAYSTDGINWTASTLPKSKYWTSVTYGDGKFVAVSDSNSNIFAYSTDGIKWTASLMPSSAQWRSIAYGDGKFVVVVYQSDVTAIYTMSYDKCYTLDQTPTTSTQVYSAPETLLAKTITSVGSGTITLSDNLTYNYTPSGNQNTYRTIGDAHPSWLCNIESIGVKVGNTMIANNRAVNNATLTITQDGVNKGTFTANANSDVTIALDAGSSPIWSYDNTTRTLTIS